MAPISPLHKTNKHLKTPVVWRIHACLYYFLLGGQQTGRASIIYFVCKAFQTKPNQPNHQHHHKPFTYSQQIFLNILPFTAKLIHSIHSTTAIADDAAVVVANALQGPVTHSNVKSNDNFC